MRGRYLNAFLSGESRGSSTCTCSFCQSIAVTKRIMSRVDSPSQITIANPLAPHCDPSQGSAYFTSVGERASGEDYFEVRSSRLVV